ncbi:unnamed protein product [Coffea canephora]|uniref:Uncharacterized protein n=1 Tax=Coffea canephora TaxID=49390 RepID=A0A068URD9_COFCA|nr:unnamed protein product [Coffea canephora]
MALEENGSGGYPEDGIVDLKGNPVLRSKRGGWTACWFVVGNSISSFPCSLPNCVTVCYMSFQILKM